MDEEAKKQISEYIEQLVTYWVSRGFDSDELIALGNRKSVEFLIQIATKAPKIENPIFFVHMQAYLHTLSQVADFKLNRLGAKNKKRSMML